MESSDEKVIPGDHAGEVSHGGSIHDVKIIPGVDTPRVDTPGEGTPVNQPRPTTPEPEAPVKQTDVALLIAASTSAGGLNAIPPDFEYRNGSWSSISSGNPFEVLYLDYRQHKTITSEMVQKNYRIISEFWADKLLIMNRGARDQIEKKYTAAVVNGAERRLEAAFNKLKTPASLDMSFHQMDGKRLEAGFSAIAELIDISVQDGYITENQANVILSKGLKNGLEAHEIEGRIISIITEKGFKSRKNVDKTRTFRNLWMTDEAWTAYQSRDVKVEWLGEYAYNLEEMGEITFRKKTESEYYLRNNHYLPPLITRLTDSASRTAEFERIIEEEKDTERKYLKILYHLHPALPFRFRGSVYNDILKLLDDATLAPDAFWMAAALFSKDHLRIWLNESAPQVAMLIPETKDVIAFLTFLYAVNRHYPFYLNNSKFTSPEDLARAMKVNQGIWVTVAQHMENGQLPAWFKAIGRADINSRYNAHLEAIINSELYDAKELKLAAAQTLILIIDAAVAVPTLSTDVSQIVLPEIEGGSVVQSRVRLRMQNSGFVKAAMKLDTDIAGITTSENELAFNSYAHENEREIVLSVDSTQLVKDRLYTLNIIVSTSFGAINIPVQIRVVFPKRAVTIKVAQYAAATALYFGLFRYLVSLLMNFDGWLADYGFVTGRYPFLFFLLVAGFAWGAVYSFRVVKKLEKI